MSVSQYLADLHSQYRTGRATEHSYRPALQSLLQTLFPKFTVTNEPQRIRCGAPDFIVANGDVPIGYLEAKDVPVRLDDKGNKEQFDRYRASLPNLCITNYLEFRFYENGELLTAVTLGEATPAGIRPMPENFARFEDLMHAFGGRITQTLITARALAEAMATKARLLATTLEAALAPDVEAGARNALTDQYSAFRDVLIHDITPRAFADLYAQTVAYGMFAARLHDDDLETFSRQEAAERIPQSNPFLRKLFQQIAGYDLDIRIRWIVDALADVFRAADVAKIMADMGRGARREDPVIHFYETFLAAYDPALRKARGVWYTPEPVVRFIVRAVDAILMRDFGLREGLADTAKTKITVKAMAKATADRRSVLKETTVVQEVPRVQILDPATGTGTFLAEVIRQIHQRFEGMAGMWSGYVESHLLPRIYGFELLMASYAMAHLKLDLLLTELGYKPKADAAQRLRVYLTNTLEEHHPDTGTLFASWLSEEANEANRVKRDAPVMVVLGNPPYSGISTNNGDWIMRLIDDYKYVDGVHFGERKHWLNDDYVKFIRMAEHFVERNGEGVVAYINNHSFLDNPTFRGMRWHLLQTFDDLYIIDLHGNSKKKEKAPDGSTDKNVFDIQQGVSINLFVKTGKKKDSELARVHHYDSWGGREEKYAWLDAHDLKAVPFETLQPEAPFYFFVQRSNEGQEGYEDGFAVNELMPVNVTGIVTARDGLVIGFDEKELLERIEYFANPELSDLQVRAHFFGSKRDGKYAAGDSRGWKLPEARAKLQKMNLTDSIKRISYRPFDDRAIFYDASMVDWGREKLMGNLLNRDNIALLACRQSATDTWEHVGITNLITDDSRVSNRTKERGYVFPLYLYPENVLPGEPHRIPNFKQEIVEKIAEGIGFLFVPDENILADLGPEYSGSFNPRDLLDYIYAVLHHPGYREQYAAFLKIDFPRVPYPVTGLQFQTLCEYGAELRALHLLEHEAIDRGKVGYPVDGPNTVDKPRQDGNRVYINDAQYFEGVSPAAWNFYIGGYQPAQKWLKDRRGRVLSYEDIRHYRRMIAALEGTARVMEKLVEVEV